MLSVSIISTTNTASACSLSRVVHIRGIGRLTGIVIVASFDIKSVILQNNFENISEASNFYRCSLLSSQLTLDNHAEQAGCIHSQRLILSLPALIDIQNSAALEIHCAGCTNAVNNTGIIVQLQIACINGITIGSQCRAGNDLAAKHTEVYTLEGCAADTVLTNRNLAGVKYTCVDIDFLAGAG